MPGNRFKTFSFARTASMLVNEIKIVIPVKRWKLSIFINLHFYVQRKTKHNKFTKIYFFIFKTKHIKSKNMLA